MPHKAEEDIYSSVCAYTSQRGKCTKIALPKRLFCDLHACPAPDCKDKKPSNDNYCAAHSGAGVAAMDSFAQFSVR